MKMRWAWTLPVLSTLALGLVGRPAAAQSSPAGPQAGPPPQAGAPVGGINPAMLAAMQAQAAGQPGAGVPMAYAPATMYVPAAYPQAAMYAPPAGMYSPYAGAMPAAYMGAPGGPEGAGAAPGQFPGGPIPDAYGAYGYAQSPNGAPGYGPPSGEYGGGGMPMAPMYGPEGGQGGPMMGGGPGMMGGGPMGGGPNMMGGPGMGGCQFCGGQGCAHCGGIFGHGGHGSLMPNGLLGDVLGIVAPYPDGGCAAVRWYDFAFDYMMLTRENTGRSDQVFATLGINGIPVLTANDLDYGSPESGFRFSAAFQVGAANSLEFTYFGQFSYHDSATARSAAGLLFTPFSDFGIEPSFGFSEFDQLDFAQLDYTSQFDSFEVNWRNRWISPNCRYQGSWTLGVRHFVLDEKLRFATASEINGIITGIGTIPARSQNDTDVTNNLTGLQIGTDMWICVLPGLRAGGEIQAGVYGNHMNINTTIGSNLIPDIQEFRERQVENDVAFIGQINLMATYRLNYQWTVRAGYQFLFLEGVALASENFNPVSPFFNDPFEPREPLANDDGNVFYHGWNVGLEFMW
jgi:hypothetical protein